MKKKTNPCKLFIFISILLCSLSIGCSVSKFMVNCGDPLYVKMNVAVKKYNDIILVRDGLPASILAVEGLLESSPENENLLLMASEAYFCYSFAFVEDKDKNRAKNLYNKSREYALRILNKRDKFWGNINSPSGHLVPIDKYNEALMKLNKKDVPALFQLVNSWMLLMDLCLNDTEALLDIPKIESTIYRIVELDENYYWGCPHALLGGYFASRSKALGGDPEKAKYHFDKAFKLSNSKLFLVHLLYAKFYAVQIQDRELYIKTLKDIISSPDNLLPEMNFLNVIAKDKAKDLLDKVDDYF